MDTQESRVVTYVSRAPAIWRAMLLSILIGCVVLVLSPDFKGNLAEPEFAVSYIGHIIGAGLIPFLFLFPWRKKTQEQFAQPAKTKAFAVAIAVLSFIVIGKIAHDFPNGEGLFHPTHAANIEYANTVCLKNLEGDAAIQQVGKVAFCSCFADQLASAIAINSKEDPALLGQRARETCLSSTKP